MFFKINKSLKIAVLVYFLIIGIMSVIRPRQFFNKDSTIKNFGIGKDKTLITVFHISFIPAVLIYVVNLLKIIKK